MPGPVEQGLSLKLARRIERALMCVRSESRKGGEAERAVQVKSADTILYRESVQL